MGQIYALDDDDRVVPLRVNADGYLRITGTGVSQVTSGRVVWAPNQGGAGGSYDTWATAYAAAIAQAGLVVVDVDLSASGGAAIPPGTYDGSRLILRGARGPDVVTQANLECSDGVVLRNLRGLENLRLFATTGQQVPIVYQAGARRFWLGDAAVLQSDNLDGLILVESGATLEVLAAGAAQLVYPGQSGPTFYLSGGTVALHLYGYAGGGGELVAGPSGTFAVHLDETSARSTSFTHASFSGTYSEVLPIPRTLSPTPVRTAATSAAFWDLVLCNPSLGGFPVTLPLVTAADHGKVVGVKNDSASANAIPVSGSGGQTIDGAVSASISFARQCLVFSAVWESGAGRWVIQ